MIGNHTLLTGAFSSTWTFVDCAIAIGAEHHAKQRLFVVRFSSQGAGLPVVGDMRYFNFVKPCRNR